MTDRTCYLAPCPDCHEGCRRCHGLGYLLPATREHAERLGRERRERATFIAPDNERHTRPRRARVDPDEPGGLF